MYTPGRTGAPKGVAISFRATAVPAKAFGELYRCTKNDRCLSYLPLAHTLERAYMEHGSIHHGYRIYFAESLETFSEDLRRARPTIFQSVPRLWLKFRDGVHAKIPAKKLERLLRIPVISSLIKKKVLTALGLDSVRYAFTGSAPVPAEVIEWYRSLGLELLEAYGMSENFAYCTMSRPGRMRVGWVGEPLPGVELRIADDGEVLVRSPAVMSSYYDQPELTEESFEEGWLKTGDRGELDHLGRLRITGRVKELFKTSKGKYVAPAPIENLLNTSGIAEQSCVMGVGEPQPFAVVMLSESSREKRKTGGPSLESALADLLTEVNHQLEHHEKLAFLAVAHGEWLISNGMLTPSMKIKRSAIEKRYQQYKRDWYEAKKRIIWETPN
jgi:long-subunit acyl-CoA synthetase (AMP-forming)